MADSKRVRISKREGALMARLSAKEQEVYEVQCSARDLYRARRPVTDYARQVYTDPAINVEFQLMTAQLAEMENSLRLKDAELKELRASIDTNQAKNGTDTKAIDSGKSSDLGDGGENKVARASALVARCQRLEQENEELASSADVAKVAQLTSEKAVAEAYAGELKTALEEAYEYIEQLEEEREVNSGKVYALEEQLRVVASQQYAQQEYNHMSLENDESHEMNDDQAIDDQSWDTRPNETLEDLHVNPKEEGDDEEKTENNVEVHTPSPLQRAPDDMDDLYGDIGGDLFGDEAVSGEAGSGKSAVVASDTANLNKEGDPMEEEGDRGTSLNPKTETENETTEDSKKLNVEEGEEDKAGEEEKEKAGEEEKYREEEAEKGKEDEAEKDKEEAVKDKDGEAEKDKEEEAEKDKEEEAEKDKEEGEHKAKKRRMGTRKSPRIRTRSTP